MFFLPRLLVFVFLFQSVALSNVLASAQAIEEIALQSGNPRYFMMFHGKEFQEVPVETLEKFIASGKYKGALDPKTEHGKTYFGVTKDSISDYGKLNLSGKGLVLAPLFFEGIGDVKILDLSREINDNSRNRALDKKNYLATVPDLSGFTNLWHLDLSYNQLMIPLDFRALTKLQYLKLHNNTLTEPPLVKGLHNLTIIMLNDNKLSSPPLLEGIVNLDSLYLSNNLLTMPPVFTGLQKIDWISISHNPLTTFPKLGDQIMLRHIVVDGALLHSQEFVSEVKSLKAKQENLKSSGQGPSSTVSVNYRDEKDDQATLWHAFLHGVDALFSTNFMVGTLYKFDLES